MPAALPVETKRHHYRRMPEDTTKVTKVHEGKPPAFSVINLNFDMKDIAEWALNIAALRGASYADTRIVDERSRTLATKNGKIGSASDAESQGIGIRVIADGAWGCAASDNLSREAVESTAAQAVAIAKASASVKQRDVQLAPEKPATAEWTSPYKTDPFTTSVEQNLELLLKIDSELRSVAGVTLAETNMNFRRDEQWLLSSEGANIHQTKYTTGVGYTAYAFAGSEIQKRSYPNSYGGQWQNRGYELVKELKLVENARRVGEEAVATLQADQCRLESATDYSHDQHQHSAWGKTAHARAAHRRHRVGHLHGDEPLLVD